MNITRIGHSCDGALALLVAIPLVAIAAPQQTFATPEAAVDALIAALKADNDAAMVAIFGEEHKDLIVQSDRAATSATRAKILAAMQTLRVLKEPSADRRVLVIGDQAWPMPIPIVRAGDRWRFATEEGEDEIVNRRIGGNELNAIYVLRAYLDAQRRTRRAIATATMCCSTRRNWPARPASTTVCIGPPTQRRAKRRAPSDRWSPRALALPQGPHGGRPVSRLLFQDPDAPGQKRARWRLQLRHQRPDDRRLRDGRVPGR